MKAKTGLRRISHNKGCQIEKRCLRCNKQFFIPEWRHKQGKGKYCSKACSNLLVYDLVCEFCKKGFKDKRPEARFCSQQCFGLNKRNRVKVVCVQCGKQTEVVPSQQKKQNFCSLSCSSKFINEFRVKNIEVPCIGCGKIRKYRVYKEDSGMIGKYCSKKCYAEHQRERLTKQCQRIGVKYADVISEKAKQRHKEKGHPWVGRKHSKESRKKMSESSNNTGKNNPMFGKDHSQEARERMSDTRSKNWILGKYENPRKFCEQGHYFSTKLKKRLFYRSSWEREYFRYLDKCDNVVDYNTECVRIPYHYDRQRWYIPDVYVQYANGNIEVQEIKPIYYCRSRKNKAKFKSAREYCKKEGIRFRVLTEKYLRYIGCEI